MGITDTGSFCLFDGDGQKKPPITGLMLRDMASSGVVQPDTLVYHIRREETVRAEDLPFLAGHFIIVATVVPEFTPAMADEKTCPFCAETIKAAAIVCKHCRRDLLTPPAPEERTAVPAPVAPALTAAPIYEVAAPRQGGVVIQEVEYFRDANVTVTNARAILDGKTYAMANVTSVTAFVEKPRYGSVCGNLLIAGFLILIGGGHYPVSSVGILWLLGAIVVLAVKKKKYRVRIGSASGEANALSSYNAYYIEKVVAAMNQAIANRG